MLTLEHDCGSPPTYQVKPPGRGANETENKELVAAIHTSAEIWSPATLYMEPLRPLFHFSPRRGWNNDPNGLMYHNGQYHMFFQHNPYGLRWGNMHWGHAVSTDLVHWEEKAIALYPKANDDFPYSGSGVVDHKNTSGWGKKGEPPMVIAFTSTQRGECIAHSNDGGKSWTEYDGNPVIQHDGRDPKLFWHAATEQWVIVVYSETGAEPAAPDRPGFAFYTSPDLKSWRWRSWFTGLVDTADLFSLQVDGDVKRTKWVLTAGLGHYYIGQFDGERFTPETPLLPGPSDGNIDANGAPIRTLYAGQTFNNHPDGHVVQIAWGGVETVDVPFTQLMSFPTTLKLRTTSEGVRLCRAPVEAIRSLRTRTYEFPTGFLTDSPLLTELEGSAWDIEAVIRVGTVSPVLLSIGGDEYIYQPAAQMLSGPRGTMPIPLGDGQLELRVLVDTTTIEILGDRGQAYGMFVRTKPGKDAPLALSTWKLMSERVRVEILSVHSLRSAWTVQRG
jgi:fructan beta-fructosidase